MAGFHVVGVDNQPQPNYPFEFIKDDAIEFMDRILWNGEYQDFVAIHASPPCQRYSVMSKSRPGLAQTYPDLIPSTRAMLRSSGLPYVIENVEHAPLINPVCLCGSQFNLTTYWEPFGKVALRRHREFETNWPLPEPTALHDHSLPTVQVYGHGSNRKGHATYGPGTQKARREVMGIFYMNREELNEAIPPAYTAYIGDHLMRYINDTLLPR